jgi:uncharacterized protein (DUF488 family)
MDLIQNVPEPKPPETPCRRIYATGCRAREVTDLPPLLKALDAILVDIRFAPSSKPLEWSKEYLKLLLKRKYLHVPSLGNRSSDAVRIAIQNLPLGLKIITELKVNVLLMCECENEAACHRRIIKDKLREKGIEVKEIQDWAV